MKPPPKDAIPAVSVQPLPRLCRFGGDVIKFMQKNYPALNGIGLILSEDNTQPRAQMIHVRMFRDDAPAQTKIDFALTVIQMGHELVEELLQDPAAKAIYLQYLEEAKRREQPALEIPKAQPSTGSAPNPTPKPGKGTPNG